MSDTLDELLRRGTLSVSGCDITIAYGSSEAASKTFDGLIDFASAAAPEVASGEQMEVDDMAALLWKTEVVGAGVPQSLINGRTREAFDDEADDLKNRWRKFARAALEAAQPALAERDAEIEEHTVRAFLAQRTRKDLEARIERLEKALTPFDSFAEFMEIETEGFDGSDELEVSINGYHLHTFKVDDFRSARKALHPEQEQSDEG